MSTNVLVTGGAGFIGSHVSRLLAEAGRNVTVMDDLSGGFMDNVPANVEFVEGSILDRALLEQLFRSGRFDFVYHLAAYAAEGLSHFIRNFNYTNNVLGSVNLINESIKHSIECFVYTSSIAVYGEGQLPMDENDVPLPEDPYGVAKYAVELDLMAAHRLFGLNHIIFRPHNIYGENQNLADPYRNVVAIFIRQMANNQPITVFGDGEQTRAFSHIDDVAGIMVEAMDRPDTYQQVFNIGADTPYTINELIGKIERAFGEKAVVTHLPARNEVKHAYSSHEKLARYFDTREQIGLEDGTRRMVEWAKHIDIQSPRPFDQIEISENLPPVWAERSG
jgi:UDP-glucose 4-epimerase